MRTVAKLSAALLACFITTQANAYIYFAHGRMLALDWADDRWILKLEIYGYESGPSRLEYREFATVEIGYRPRCVQEKEIRTGKQPGEFEQAIEIFRRQIESGETVRFGWDARDIPGKRGEFVAVNLRAYGVGRPDEMVWIIGPAMLEQCKFKYRGT
jgi:hypothetical protein